jgi:hypothetical protein
MVGVMLPVVLLALTTVLSGPVALQAQGDMEPVLLPVGSAQVRTSQEVTLALTWSEGAPLLSPGGDGLVTSVEAAPGDRLEQGATVARVNDRALRAVVAAGPFYRPIGSGDEGPDVARLRRVLIELGYLAGDPTLQRVTPALDRAIGQFNAAGGYTRQRVGEDGTLLGHELQPADVIWIGPEPVVVGQLDLRPGQPLPPPGEPIGRRPSTLISLAVQSGEGRPPADLAELAPAAVELRVEGQPSATIDVPAGGTLEAPAVAAVVPPGTETVRAVARPKGGAEASSVPASAVVGGERGPCVLVPDSGADGYRPVPIEPLRSGFGESIVKRLAVTEVLGNPYQVLERPSCHS